MKSIYNTKYDSWVNLEKAIGLLPTKHEKGDAFEEFVYFYLLYNSDLYQIESGEIYSPRATKLPFPKDVLKHLKLEKKDHGVDGVYINKQGEWIAYQAKFRSGRGSLDYTELSTFWTEAEYADKRLIFTNSTTIPELSSKKFGHLAIQPDILDNLDANFFNALHLFALDNSAVQIKKIKTPREYQKEIINDLEAGFRKNDRGKMIAACGIGKTLLALWLTERLDNTTVLFLAPSLQLIRQTLGEWAAQSSSPFEYLCVCSDDTVDLDDGIMLSNLEVDISVTTESDSIRHFLEKTTSNKRIIFSTYHSVPVIVEACKSLTKFDGFDITIYDEAHRTAGVSGSNLFSLGIDDAIISSKLRLFMTATERLVKARTREAASEANQIVFSMDDEKKYGKVFYRLSFGKAIAQNIISDYRIVFAGITTSEMNELIEKNKYVVAENGLTESDKSIAAQQIFRQILLKRCIDELGIKKVITFHSKISEAKYFADQFRTQLRSKPGEIVSVNHVNGQMTSVERSQSIKEFEKASLGVLTNVRCLTEGVDIPLIDAVFFADPKGSQIDIVQAVGRALRQPYGAEGKMAYIIIPILLDEIEGKELTDERFDSLYNVIQALRDQDEILAEWIDHINLAAVKGHAHTGKMTDKVKIILNQKFDVSALESALMLKIADINKEPSGYVGIGSKLGKTERKSAYTRFYKTPYDYTSLKLKVSLIDPTFDLINDVDIPINKDLIKIDHNNVSHCVRLGLLKEMSKKTLNVTKLGKQYKKGILKFTDLFKNQMLLVSINEGKNKIYPYREAFKYIKELKSMGRIDFTYGIYSLQMDSFGGPLLEEAIVRSKYIMDNFPNIEMTNEANRPSILESLNELHPVGFRFEEVWTDRLTPANQFRYLCRHLELFENLFYFNNNRLFLISGCEKEIDKYLDTTLEMLDDGMYGEKWWID